MINDTPVNNTNEKEVRNENRNDLSGIQSPDFSADSPIGRITEKSFTSEEIAEF
jgi:hypothetical protein